MQQPDVEKIGSASDLEAPNLEQQKISSAPELELPDGEEDTRGDRQSNRSPWRWSLLWLLMLVPFTGLALGAFLWLVAMPPAPQCEEISNLASDRERLSCAQLAAESGDPDKLAQALNLVGSWAPDHPMRKEGQALAAYWSGQIVEQARKKVEANDLETAVSLLKSVPPSNPEYEDVQAKLTEWQKSWQQGRAIWKNAETALKAKEWTKAAVEADKLTAIEDPYWRIGRFGQFMERIASEKQGWRQLALAEKAAKLQTPFDYQRAVKLASRIDAETFAKIEAKPKVAAWSRVLLDKAIEFKQVGDLAGAMELAQAIPADVDVRDSARQFIQLTRAQSLVQDGLNFDRQISEQLWTLVNAKAVSAQLKVDSPFYEDTQAQLPEWQIYLQDLLHLQMASSIAGLGIKPTFGMAIEQAQAIGKDRPTRVYAQSLMAKWVKQAKEADDRPYMVRAQQLAALGTKKGYQAAIAQASLIASGHPLRNEAQTIVADSRNQIEILEDRPILDRAEKLAKKEKYNEAIEAANQIKGERALYAKAQASIKTWLDIQDRKVLDEAAILANNGKLTEAIATASQVGLGSSLYKDAQGKIADWLIARDGLPVRAPAGSVAESNPLYNPPASTYYEEPAPSYSESAPTYSEPAPTYSEPAPTYYSEPAPTYYEEPAPTYYEEPAPSYSEPAPTYYEPAPSYSDPAPTYYEEPAPTYDKEPVSTYSEEPAPSYSEEPATDYLPKKHMLNP